MGIIESKQYKDDIPQYSKKTYKKNFPGINRYKTYNNKVFWEGEIVDGAKGDNFIDIGYGYGKDNKFVYYNGKKLQVSKVRTFNTIRKNYASDGITSFFKDIIIKNKH